MRPIVPRGHGVGCSHARQRSARMAEVDKLWRMADPSGERSDSTTESVEEASAEDKAPDEPTPPESSPEHDQPHHPEPAAEGAVPPTEVLGTAESPEYPSAEPTVAMATQQPAQPPPTPPTVRRFTAPSSFDAGSTEKIERPPDPATEVLPESPSAQTAPVAQPGRQPKTAMPQSIPGRMPARRRRSWGWVLALILVIAALAAVAILGTVWLTRDNAQTVSQEDQVRAAIQNFDSAVQKGDLAALRGMTCGTTRDAYVNYDDRAWADTHARVAAAKQYPLIASIDQVVVNGGHAEANVTTFMAFAPQVRSTRSFDLQFRDDQWKICEALDN
jgi:hypothetical protein